MIYSHNYLLSFLLHEKRFAVALDTVESVVRSVAVTSIPGANELIHGIFDFHGIVIPAINLRYRLGMPTKEISLNDRFIIIQTSKRKLALVVDEIEEVQKPVDNDISEIEIPITENQLNKSQHPGIIMTRLFRDIQGIILIYDVEKLLDSDVEIQLDALLKYRDGAAVK
ncbi:MAG: chemotaxis protein CheW [Bacteroidetes bacterium HGW-Bacteroidetes-1]|jgi:purine-binding chemotaxis protein CheW|nr:MAG: chemotaxis protein CheW [Bacteroidetes bacterium HGW-Bacteroidetes-1]